MEAPGRLRDRPAVPDPALRRRVEPRGDDRAGPPARPVPGRRARPARSASSSTARTSSSYVAGFRPPHATDVSGDEKRARNAVSSVNKAGLLIGAPTDDRFEISEAIESLLPARAAPGAAGEPAARPTTPTREEADDAAVREFEPAAERRAIRRGGAAHETERADVDDGRGRAELTRARASSPQGVVAAPSDDTLQWRAELLQLVNWGGFSGRVTVDLHGDATMISGASGVGKSTVLDAYTALMMPSDTKFNGASNDAVAGRARGAGPAQPAVLPARCGRRGRRPAHRAPGRDSCSAARAATPGARSR